MLWFSDDRMTSDQDKFVKVATQEARRLHESYSGVAGDVIVPVMMGALILGVILGIWIFRGGLSRTSASILSLGRRGRTLRVEPDAD